MGHTMTLQRFFHLFSFNVSILCTQSSCNIKTTDEFDLRSKPSELSFVGCHRRESPRPRRPKGSTARVTGEPRSRINPAVLMLLLICVFIDLRELCSPVHLLKKNQTVSSSAVQPSFLWKRDVTGKRGDFNVGRFFGTLMK